MQKIFFHYTDRKPVIAGKPRLKEIVVEIFKRESVLLERVDYIFCSDDSLLRINIDFLQHDFYTDIITFDLSDSKAKRGEIYISVDRIKENALSHKTTFRKEIARVIFHGALHLCGYKDKKKADIQLMREKEDHYIRLLQ